MNAERERLCTIGCECGASHFVTLVRWPADTDDPGRTYLSLIEESRADGFWDRIKGAWFVLVGRNHDWCEVLLDDEAAVHLARALVPVTRGSLATWASAPPILVQP